MNKISPFMRLVCRGWICLLLVSGACSRKADPLVREDLSRRCVVIEPVPEVVLESGTTGWTKWLTRHIPSAPRFSSAQLDEAVAACVESDLVMVVPSTVSLQDGAREKLSDYVAGGGRLLSLGRNYVLDAKDVSSYTVTSRVVTILDQKVPIEISPRSFECTYPGPSGAGGEAAGLTRWIPVLELNHPDGAVIGWPGSVRLYPGENNRYAIVGWLAVDARGDDTAQLLPLLNAMLSEMTREIYLLQFGVTRSSMPAKSGHTATAEFIDRRMRDLTPVRLAVQWINSHGQEVRRHISAPLDAMDQKASLNIGLAPDPPSNPEFYTLRISIRDRNDQRSFDTAEQTIKVFSGKTEPPQDESISVNAGQFVQGRRPIFMLGVNYWPRLSASVMRDGGHWLDPGNFDPAIVIADLDQMVSVGINSIALEYTDLNQAPQLLFVLDELRRRSMWASLYVPSLHPLDLRMEEAGRMLRAIRLNEWPEVFAVEIARGLPVQTRIERRRLDASWAAWLEEHFNSISEAEQKLGVSLWRERGNIVGPPDTEVMRGPQSDPAVALYYAFLTDYAARRMGYAHRWLRSNGYNVLVTARSTLGWPGTPPKDTLDVLDLSTGAMHLDFMFPDAWTVHPLRTMYPDADVLAAYARGAGNGKPIVWAAYGQHVGQSPDAASCQRQKEVYKHFLDLFIKQGASGAFAWWYPPGKASVGEEDWGIMHPAGTWRPVEESFRNARLQMRQLRVQPRTPVRGNAPLIQSASQWNAMQAGRSGLFAQDTGRAAINEWNKPGTGISSMSLLQHSDFMQSWSEIDGFCLLNAEWGEVQAAGAAQDRSPGENIRVYSGRTLKMELFNSGTVRWTGAPDRTVGSVWLRISQPGQQDEWLPVETADHAGRQTVTWLPRVAGLWEIQPHLIGYGKFGERLRIEVTVPPRLF